MREAIFTSLADLLREYLEKDRAHRLILVLVDLTVHTHMSWAHAIDMSPERAREAWADLMSDIEEWRTSNEEP